MSTTKKIFLSALAIGAAATCIDIMKRVKENNPDGINDSKEYLFEAKKAGVELCIDVSNAVVDYAPEIIEVSKGLLDNLFDFLGGTHTLLKLKYYDIRASLED